MMTLYEIKAKLHPMNLKTVASESGVHYNAIYRLMKGSTEPKYETVQKLVKWLEKNK